jgi:UDP-glucose 4-epimerase
MSILVFGKNGFLASRLKKNFQKNNIKVKFIGSNEIDLTKKNSLKKLKKFNKIYSIIFLSALTPDKGKDEKTFIKNISMITNLFKYFTEENIQHFLYVSSDAVYNLSQNKINNNTAPSPSDLYGLMHLSRENICKFKILKKNLTILRPTIVYGKGDTHNSYGPNRFIGQLKKNQNIKIFGKGLDIRDHLYVEDLIKIISKAILKKISGTYNVASGSSFKFIDVVKKIRKLTRKKINIDYIKVNNLPTKRYFDIVQTKNKFKLNFTNLNLGLKKYL